MANKKHPFHRVRTVTASAGTNLIKDVRVRPARLYCYQRVAVENETSPYTRLRIEVRGRGPDFLSSEQQQPRDDVLYWDDVPIYATEGMTLTVELTGCTADDLLKMYVTGWWIKDDGEGV